MNSNFSKFTPTPNQYDFILSLHLIKLTSLSMCTKLSINALHFSRRVYIRHIKVMTKFIYNLGVAQKWNVVDVYGLDEESLGFISKPVKAVILLFPCSEAVSILYRERLSALTFFHWISAPHLQYEKHRAAEDVALKENPPKMPNDLFYMKQVIHNACGTIALVHSIANNPE